MAKQLLSCKASDSLGDAEKTMREARVRRLPVVDGQGALIGIIGLADLAREAARERTASKQDITESEVGDTLAAICRSNAGRRLSA
jgi:CBS domain-containing protein